jgi:adenosylcobinamide amidohydrolase
MSEALTHLRPVVAHHGPDGEVRPALLWSFPEVVRVISSAVWGGGIGERRWVVNAEVSLSYGRTDVETHAQELAGQLDCPGDGVVLLTAAPVRDWTAADENGVEVVATVGLSKPTWAADLTDPEPWRPGTVNLVAWVPVRLSDAALVNAVATVTEAKSQVLLAAGVAGTGTASDAVCLCCPADGPEEPFGGPRSRWGTPLARATHQAVAAGTAHWLARHTHGNDQAPAADER